MSAGASIAVESDLTLRKLKTAAVCLLGQSFGTSMLALLALTFVMVPMTGEFGWTRTQFSYGMTAVMWCGALTGPVFGRLVDRCGVRPVVLIGTSVVGLATLALCRTYHLWQFCLCYVLLGLFAPSTNIGYVKVMGAAFNRNRGKAFAIMAALFSIVSSIFPQIINVLLSHMGWRGVFTGTGILILGVLVILFFTLEETGDQKPESVNTEAGIASVEDLVQEGLSAAEVRRDRIFWILCAAGLLWAVLYMGWTQHQLAFLMDRGFTRQQVVNLFSLAMFASPLITLLGGWLMDRGQSARIAIPFVLLTALGILGQFVVWVRPGAVPLLFLAIYLGMVVTNVQVPMMQYFYSRYFGMKAFGEVLSIFLSIQAFAMGFSAPLFGLIFDRTRSYNPALLLMIAGDIGAVLLFLTLGRYRYSVDKKSLTPEEMRAEAASTAANS